MRKEQRIEKLRHLFLSCELVLNEVEDCDNQGLLDGTLGAKLSEQAYRLTVLAERALGKAAGVVRGWDYE